MSRARQVMRTGRGSQRVLVVCGYSYVVTRAYKHLQKLDRALRESAGNLTIVVFTGEGKPTGQMKEWADDKGIRDKS